MTTSEDPPGRLGRSLAILYDVRTELRGVLDTVGDAVMIVDEKWRVLNANPASADLFGYRQHELVARPVSTLFVARGERRVLAALQQTFAAKGRQGPWEGSLLGRHRDGQNIPVSARIGRYRDGGLVRYVLVLRDNRGRRRAERVLRQAALHDPLTGLLNRAAFAEELQRTIERARRTSTSFAVLMLDLDHFKEINDSTGHQAGDLLLRQIGHRLREQIRGGDVLARLGGDEFAVIFDNDASPADGTTLAERLIAAVARPFYVAGVEAHIGTSIGIAVFPEDARDGDLLLARADMAMYAAKASGRGGWRLFDPRMQQVATARRLLESELRIALRESQLRLLYQPLVRISDLEVSGFEALLRWDHPVRGLLRPEEFVPFAERNRLIQPITEWVLDQAIDEIATLERVEALPTAINISTRIFDQDSLVECIERACARAPGFGMQLVLEITEGALAGHERAAEILAMFRRLGVRIAIDDFGIGYSSLARLKDLPLDLLKIDRSFIANLPRSHADRAVADSIVRLSGSLGMATVAEGVETLEQLRAVIDLGCDQAQGYLFARPMAITSVSGWIERWRRQERHRVSALCWPGERLRVAMG